MAIDINLLRVSQGMIYHYHEYLYLYFLLSFFVHIRMEGAIHLYNISIYYC